MAEKIIDFFGIAVLALTEAALFTLSLIFILVVLTKIVYKLVGGGEAELWRQNY